MTASRNRIIEELRRRLVGPGLGQPDPSGNFDNELIEGRLSLAYMMGMLFPQEAREDVDLAGDEDEEVEDDADDPLSMATAMLPSSMGLSVCIEPGTVLEATFSGARYEQVLEASASDEKPGRGRSKRDGTWRRVPLKTTTLEIGQSGFVPTDALEGHAVAEVLSRTLPDGSCLVTVSVRNAAVVKGPRSSGETLYQVNIDLQPKSGQILQYPAARFIPPTDDERELRVVYGSQRPFAAGHGIAADWKLKDGACVNVRTEPVPTAHVWRPVFDNLSIGSGAEMFDDSTIFDIAPLARGEISVGELVSRLEGLVSFYDRWIASQWEIMIEPGLEEDVERMVRRCEASARRMRAGIAVLAENEEVARCFMLANRAMLMAMHHADRTSGRNRPDGIQGPFDLGKAETAAIDYYSGPPKRWRPFQLAFFLQVLPSLAGKGLPDRDMVDVIWFATGGGKTEAYLLLSAFELVRRRIIDGETGGGTGIINRYTYRFLTADQFQRTAGMICALESIRRELAEAGDYSLGGDEFSIGLFVGGEVSPNNLAGAHEKLGELLDSSDPRGSNPFPIESCPSCGTLLVPRVAKRLPDGSPDLAFYGFQGASNAFKIYCTDEDCQFHDQIPVYIVDEQLYRNPPSFLLGTVDKFAMVPWNEKSGRLFGVGTETSSPSLIIQDELHLISGPLGTLAGLYEAAFETIIESTGSPPPKVIASTATIRNSAVQCRRIYGRSSAVFPSPGIGANDSFFSKLDVNETERSRLYVGIMGQGLRSTVAVTWAISAMLQIIYEQGQLAEYSPEELDAYWTLVAYHNSKRELGRITNATRDEIPTRLKVYARNPASERPSKFEVMELKANAETPIPQARQMLGRKHSKDNPAIDIVPCTNIISVGVDIDRLGLMMVNGQPKLSAEYIQATSRVGRGKVPGLVVTCYSPSKPRDRSHYEAFRDYHERFYSFVEPTSVTPGALPAIERALHAALVITVRHGAGLVANSDAARFDPTKTKTATVINRLTERLLAAYSHEEEAEERARLSEKLAEKVDEWFGWAKSGNGLRYNMAPGQRKPTLLVRYGDRKTDGVGWITLQSMRHVDKEITLETDVNG